LFVGIDLAFLWLYIVCYSLSVLDFAFGDYFALWFIYVGLRVLLLCEI